MRGRRPVIRNRSVLRYVYEREYGPVPPGFVVARADHAKGCSASGCIHDRCVNPSHLTIERTGGGRKPSQECPSGHDLTLPENVYEAAGRRWCRTCLREGRSEWERRNPNYLKNWRAKRKRNGRQTDPKSVAHE